ncbi:auxilin-like protein 1 [Melia azedarach]|uniref:Auxilin-like protein 1 n=2 Tax=Melia azedarach TaxID=155640 RepID=A0ACC1XTA6_MELAZ|nr:auxilin-like protein 1 [Melia azedarach]
MLGSCTRAACFVWTPAETDSLSEDSGHSGKNQSLSDGDSYESIDGSMEFSISYHKANQRSDEDMSKGITHVTQLHAVPGYTFLVDKTTPLEKAYYVNPPLEVTDDSNLYMDFGEGVMREKNLRKTLSQPCTGGSGEQTFASGLKPQRGYSRNSSLPNEMFVTISEINLRTQPSEVPPPCRPAPLLDVTIGDSGEIPKNNRTTASEGTVGDSSPPFYDVEVDASSSAAASAAAVKEVMEKAQAKLKTAKELLERKRDAVQSRKHDKKDKDEKIFGSVGGPSGIKEERVHGSCGRQANEMKFCVREERQRDIKTMKAVPDSVGGENLFNVDRTLEEKHGRPDKIDGAGEWKEATEFFELVKTDRSTFERINYDDFLVPDTRNHEFRQKMKKGAMEAVEQQQVQSRKIETNSKDPELVENEAYERKLKSAKEAYERQESNRRSGASKATRKHKGHEKQVKVAQEVFEQVEDEKKFRMVQHSVEIEKKPTGNDEPDNRENLVKVQKESRFKDEKAVKHQKNEKRLEETNRSKENETRFKESCEREANGGSQREAFQQEENEKKLKEAFEPVESEKKVKETLEQEDKERWLKGIFEQVEKEKKLKEAHKREESEKKMKEALEQIENEKQQREAREREEYEKRQREAREREEYEKWQREAREREEYEKPQREAREREEYEKQQREAHEREEYEKQQWEAREREEYEKQQREAHEREEYEKKLEKALENEERERKQKEAAKKEETEKRLQEACEREKMERRLKEAHEREETRKRLGEVFEPGNNCTMLNEALGRVEKCDTRSKETFEKEENRNMSKEARSENEKSVEDAGEVEDLMEPNGAYEQTRWDEYGKKLKMAEGPRVFKEVEDLKVSEMGQFLDNNEDIGVTELAGQHAENGKKGQVTQGAFAHEENIKIQIENRDSEMVAEAVEIPNEMVDRKFEVFNMAQGNLKNEEYIVKMKGVVEPLCKDHSARTSEPGTGTGQEKTKSALQADSGIRNQERKFANEWVERQTNVKQAQVGLNQKENKEKFVPTQPVKESIHNGRKMEASQASSLEGKGHIQKTVKSVNTSQSSERKEKDINEILTSEDKEAQRMRRERELENERLRKIEEEREREREREKDRMAVDIATLEAREKVYAEVRERTERSAVERATAEARQRALAEARERLEKACAEAKEKSLAEKASTEARLRAERAAVERATAEARERAVEKAMAERAAFEARERVDRTSSEKISASRNSAMRPSSSSSDLQDQKFQSASSLSSSRYPYSSGYGASYSTERSEGVEGESVQRCRARLERHRRTAERAAKALAEKNMRDLLAQREQAERNRLAETLDADVKRWSSGKEGNLRALLSTLQYILGPDSGWHPIPLTEVITSAAVKKAYRKATLCVHPDKLQQRGASIQQKYICEKVFDLLKEAWNKFNSEER